MKRLLELDHNGRHFVAALPVTWVIIEIPFRLFFVPIMIIPIYGVFPFLSITLARCTVNQKSSITVV